MKKHYKTTFIEFIWRQKYLAWQWIENSDILYAYNFILFNNKKPNLIRIKKTLSLTLFANNHTMFETDKHNFF